MPRICKACKHPKQREIDRALLLGESFRDIAGRYRLSKSALSRHKNSHIRPILKEAARQEEQQRRVITVQEVWELVTTLCLFDPADWHNQFGALKDINEIPWDARMAIQSVKRREIFNDEDKDHKSIIGETKEYKAISRLQALELAAKLHQLLKPAEVQQNQFNVILTKSDDELRHFIEHHCWPSAENREAITVTASEVTPPAGSDGDRSSETARTG